MLHTPHPLKQKTFFNAYILPETFITSLIDESQGMLSKEPAEGNAKTWEDLPRDNTFLFVQLILEGARSVTVGAVKLLIDNRNNLYLQLFTRRPSDGVGYYDIKYYQPCYKYRNYQSSYMYRNTTKSSNGEEIEFIPINARDIQTVTSFTRHYNTMLEYVSREEHSSITQSLNDELNTFNAEVATTLPKNRNILTDTHSIDTFRKDLVKSIIATVYDSLMKNKALYHDLLGVCDISKYRESMTIQTMGLKNTSLFSILLPVQNKCCYILSPTVVNEKKITDYQYYTLSLLNAVYHRILNSDWLIDYRTGAESQYLLKKLNVKEGQDKVLFFNTIAKLLQHLFIEVNKATQLDHRQYPHFRSRILDNLGNWVEDYYRYQVHHYFGLSQQEVIDILDNVDLHDNGSLRAQGVVHLSHRLHDIDGSLIAVDLNEIINFLFNPTSGFTDVVDVFDRFFDALDAKIMEAIGKLEPIVKDTIKKSGEQHFNNFTTRITNYLSSHFENPTDIIIESKQSINGKPYLSIGINGVRDLIRFQSDYEGMKTHVSFLKGSELSVLERSYDEVLLFKHVVAVLKLIQSRQDLSISTIIDPDVSETFTENRLFCCSNAERNEAENYGPRYHSWFKLLPYKNDTNKSKRLLKVDACFKHRPSTSFTGDIGLLMETIPTTSLFNFDWVLVVTLSNGDYRYNEQVKMMIKVDINAGEDVLTVLEERVNLIAQHLSSIIDI